MQIVLDNSELSRLVIFQMNLLEVVLDGIGHHLVDPLVAGGAPREWYFGKSAKDIDIFIRNPVEEIGTLVKIIEESFPTCIVKYTLSSDLNANYRSDDIDAVIDMSLQGEIFQFILIKNSVRNVLFNFPCTICMISYKDGVLYPNKYFLRSVRTSHLYFKKDTNSSYVNRMKLYFPKYTYSEYSQGVDEW